MHGQMVMVLKRAELAEVAFVDCCHTWKTGCLDAGFRVDQQARMGYLTEVVETIRMMFARVQTPVLAIANLY